MDGKRDNLLNIFNSFFHMNTPLKHIQYYEYGMYGQQTSSARLIERESERERERERERESETEREERCKIFMFNPRQKLVPGLETSDQYPTPIILRHPKYPGVKICCQRLACLEHSTSDKSGSLAPTPSSV